MKKYFSYFIKYGLPIAISAALAWFLSKNVDWGAIRDSLKQDVNYWWFLPVIVVSIFSHVFRAMRWRLQLRALGITPPLRVLICSIFGTYFVNLLFPRLGELWRCGYISRREKAPFTTVFGSMLGDRLSDTVTVALLTIITFFLAAPQMHKFLGARGDTGSSGFLSAWWFWLVIALGVVGVAFVWWLFKANVTNTPLLKVRGLLKNLWDGFAAIGKMEGKWMFLLYTVLIWGCYFTQLYIATFAFTFTAGLSVVAVLVLFVLSSIGMAVPTNGGLGAWQFAIIFGLALYGVGEMPPPFDEQASAFAWLVWGVQTLLLIVLGIYAFLTIKLKD